MAFVKHIGRHNNKKVVVVYRTVPGEDHMALVVYTDGLPTPMHDAIMKVIESPTAQEATELSEVLHRNLLNDGRPILEGLHVEGRLKKAPTSQVIMTPNASSHIRLDELNNLMSAIDAGGEAKDRLEELDRNAGLADPAAKRADSAAPAATDGVLSDADIARDLLAQATKMAADAEVLLAESKRLQTDAYKLDASLKPKRTRRAPAKKAAPKKSSSKKG